MKFMSSDKFPTERVADGQTLQVTRPATVAAAAAAETEFAEIHRTKSYKQTQEGKLCVVCQQII